MRYVTYSNESKHKVNDWFLYVIKATDVDNGVSYWRWAKSRIDDWKFKVWNDKNKKARLPERKYFMTQNEAYEAGRSACFK